VIFEYNKNKKRRYLQYAREKILGIETLFTRRGNVSRWTVRSAPVNSRRRRCNSPVTVGVRQVHGSECRMGGLQINRSLAGIIIAESRVSEAFATGARAFQCVESARPIVRRAVYDFSTAALVFSSRTELALGRVGFSGSRSISCRVPLNSRVS
jgi:hypothetical protein